MASQTALLLLSMAVICVVYADDEDAFALCELVHPALPDLKGTIDFRQKAGSDVLEAKVSITGLDPNDNVLLHGLHVHEFGRTVPNCDMMGDHWNPDGTDHGGPNDSPLFRHPGDFGNVREDAAGNVFMSFTDTVAGLHSDSEYNIGGRGIVLHQHDDDLGRGGSPDSLKNGNSGSRYACCVVSFWDGSRW